MHSENISCAETLKTVPKSILFPRKQIIEPELLLFILVCWWWSAFFNVSESLAKFQSYESSQKFNEIFAAFVDLIEDNFKKGWEKTLLEAIEVQSKTTICSVVVTDVF